LLYLIILIHFYILGIAMNNVMILYVVSIIISLIFFLYCVYTTSTQNDTSTLASVSFRWENVCSWSICLSIREVKILNAQYFSSAEKNRKKIKENRDFYTPVFDKIYFGFWFNT